MGPETAPIVVTACGKRKSLEPLALLRAATLDRGPAPAVAAQWTARLASADGHVPARTLYKGRAFREAEIAAAGLGSSLYVISAGLGLISADRRIPSYSLTVANGEDNVMERLAPPKDATAASWWEALHHVANGHSFDELLHGAQGLLLIAGGGSYLGMIAPELTALTTQKRGRLRIFTAAPSASLAEPLRPFVMPYDRRLERLPSARPGVLADFAQRALRHFAEHILPAASSADARGHADRVRAALAGLEAPERHRGASATDAEIVALIRRNWSTVQGRSGELHRLLRGTFNIACEQKRFRRLFAAARTRTSPE